MTRAATQRWSTAAALALLLSGSPALARSPEPHTFYTVRKGDTLLDIAARYLAKISNYQEVQRINRINYERRLVIGSRLRIPVRILRRDRVFAYVASVRGLAYLENPSGRLQILQGDKIGEGDRLTTARDSFLSLKMSGEATLNLSPQSSLFIKRLRRTALSGHVESIVLVQEGRVKTRPPKLRPGESFQVETPISVSAVRGTDFRTSFDRIERKAGTEVLGGVVNTETQTAESPFVIPAGNGLMVEGRVTGSPRPLLPAPRVAGIVADPSSDLRVTLVPIEGATTYHAQLASDAAFSDVVAESWSRTADLELPDNLIGGAFLRVSAVDAIGLEGLAEVHPMPSPVVRHGATIAKDGRFQISGQRDKILRIQIMRDRPDGSILVDHVGPIQEVSILNLEKGIYYWRSMDLAEPSQSWTVPERLIITRP